MITGALLSQFMDHTNFAAHSWFPSHDTHKWQWTYIAIRQKHIIKHINGSISISTKAHNSKNKTHRFKIGNKHDIKMKAKIQHQLKKHEEWSMDIQPDPTLILKTLPTHMHLHREKKGVWCAARTIPFQH